MSFLCNVHCVVPDMRNICQLLLRSDNGRQDGHQDGLLEWQQDGRRSNTARSQWPGSILWCVHLSTPHDVNKVWFLREGDKHISQFKCLCYSFNLHGWPKRTEFNLLIWIWTRANIGVGNDCLFVCFDCWFVNDNVCVCLSVCQLLHTVDLLFHDQDGTCTALVFSIIT